MYTPQRENVAGCSSQLTCVREAVAGYSSQLTSGREAVAGYSSQLTSGRVYALRKAVAGYTSVNVKTCICLKGKLWQATVLLTSGRVYASRKAVAGYSFIHVRNCICLKESCGRLQFPVSVWTFICLNRKLWQATVPSYRSNLYIPHG